MPLLDLQVVRSDVRASQQGVRSDLFPLDFLEVVRVSGFGQVTKTAKAVRISFVSQITPLKRGVNETGLGEITGAAHGERVR